MLPENKIPESRDPADNRKNADAGLESKDDGPTEVPNAHASGLGAMGRNDEKLPTSPDDAEDRPEAAY